MRKVLLSIFLVFSLLSTYSQNVQFHYDFGHLSTELSERPSVTTTIECYKPDKWGNTFFFVDLDYYHDGMAGGYWELSREINISPNKQWAAHIEYDGGVSSNPSTDLSTRFQHSILAGPAWNWASADYSRTLSFQALYKYYFKGQNPWNTPFSSFQGTCVWSIQFVQRKVTFSGFFDCWYDQHVRSNWITVTEPQLWMNLNAFRGLEDIHLSIGTEVEVSNNFVYNKQGRNDQFHAIPTLAIKWTF